MKWLVALLVSVALALSLAQPSGAASRRDKQRRDHSRAYTPPTIVTPEQKRRNAQAYERGDYYERDSNALPVGSKAWFEQKEREDGCC